MDRGWLIIGVIAGVIIGLAFFLSVPAESLVTSIPPTRAIADIFTQNTSIHTKSYADFVELSGIKDIEVRGRPAAHEVIIQRNPLSGGETSYFSTVGTAIIIDAASDGYSNMVKVSPTTTFINFTNFDDGGANGRIRYTGGYNNTFHVAVTISMAADEPNDSFVYGIAKNGAVISSSKVIMKITNAADTKSTALHVAVPLAKNDYLELYVGNLDDGGDALVKTLNIFALGM